MIGEAKADAVRRILTAFGIAAEECFAYADDESDLPLLRSVGHPSSWATRRSPPRLRNGRPGPGCRVPRR
ncbi:hypothetical protein O1L60_21900 [Streptomyces diastatochromogenes]|nr:hypothetical protein [Streptomyces diastatochromogenes]